MTDILIILRLTTTQRENGARATLKLCAWCSKQYIESYTCQDFAISAVRVLPEIRILSTTSLESIPPSGKTAAAAIHHGSGFQKSRSCRRLPEMNHWQRFNVHWSLTPILENVVWWCALVTAKSRRSPPFRLASRLNLGLIPMCCEVSQECMEHVYTLQLIVNSLLSDTGHVSDPSWSFLSASSRIECRRKRLVCCAQKHFRVQNRPF